MHGGTIVEFGIVGLGKMGSNLARQALDKGHKSCWVRAARFGAQVATSMAEFAAALTPPRIVLARTRSFLLDDPLCL
jgi:6-phosphogluconate dehydrogenase (decarboxylating)